MNVPAETVSIIHMTEGNILCRCPPDLWGKRFSVISLGMCNFHCPYCQLGGGLPRLDNRIPLAVDVPVGEAEQFIVEQVAKGNPVKVSGGEPTLDMPLAIHLLDYIRSRGGYACADTSGWAPERTAALADHADQIAIDLKGPPRYAAKVTGVGLEQCWFPVVESIRVAAGRRATLEVRTVFFDFTQADDLRIMAEHIPAAGYWLVRRFMTSWVPFDKYARSRYSGFAQGEVTYPAWLRPPEPGRMRAVVREALGSGPTPRPRTIVLTGSPRDSGGDAFAGEAGELASGGPAMVAEAGG